MAESTIQPKDGPQNSPDGLGFKTKPKGVVRVNKKAVAFAGFMLASAIPFVFGIPYMAFILNVVGGGTFGVSEILAFGLWPFVVGGLVKAAIAALLIPAAWAAVRAVDRTKKS